MRPQRRVAATEDHAPANLHAIGKVYFMPGGDDTAIPQNEARIDLIHHVGLGNGVDLVHADDFGVPSQTYFRTAANNIQMADTHVVPYGKFFNPRDHVEMTDADVVFD